MKWSHIFSHNFCGSGKILKKNRVEWHNKIYDLITTSLFIVFFYIFHLILFYFHRTPLKVNLILSTLYT